MVALPPKHKFLFATKFYDSFANYLTGTSNSAVESNYPVYMDSFLGLVDIVSSICTIRIPYSVDSLLFTVALGLWVPCKYFSEILENGNLEVKDILDMFEDLRVLSDLLNQVFNGLVVSFVLNTMLYYSIHLMDFVLAPSIIDRLVLTICLVGTTGTFYFAAESCANVSHYGVPSS